MRLLLTILLGKFIFKITRAFKIGGGSAAPGLYALKIDPDLVNKLSTRIPRNVIITGTNGKTTTARMLAHFAKENGLRVIRNHTGSNLERGVASTLINSYSHLTSGKVDLGIWELDEAAFNLVAPKIKPDVIVFLNVFRDQLDRYGEVDSVVKAWAKTLKKLPKNTTILVNGDDANTAKLASLKFGVKDYKIVGESILHKKERENLDCEIKNVKLKGLSGSSFSVVVHKKAYPVRLSLPGVYHIYDFLAAFYAGHELGFSSQSMIKSLKGFSPAFGRYEKFTFPHSKWEANIFLIKNPAGATQVFQTIAPELKRSDKLLLALNDNLADGTDVSWIWDGQFELLKTKYTLGSDTIQPPRLYVSGTRAADLAVRLKYAGFDPNQIIIEPDLKKALKEARQGLKDRGRLFILPTYTAMLTLQNILAKSGLKKHYWEET